ncbi:MAG: dihydrodipicolinate synthase family protein, partial [Clostridia bacterium]|nr:dihydrodipicolinate synthase family protein [Clostridia bacterium]
LGDLLAKGADGFYLCGATGEGIAIAPEQRMILAEEAIKVVDGRKPCIVQVASGNFEDAIRLTKHAEKVGAAAISATPPLFFSYDKDDVYNYYKKLADAVSIPMMIYYNPAAGFHINADIAAKMFEIDNVTAIKWTSSDYYQMMRLRDLTHGEMNIINGPDEMLLMGLSAGADGGIGTTYNFMFDIIRGIYDNFVKGDIETAREYQTRAIRIISVLLGYKIIPAAKAVLEAQGYAVGDATFPMKRYSDEEKATIVAQMRAAGLKI